MAEGKAAPVDHETLAQNLEALANGIRLEILDRLRLPRALSEIRVAPRRATAGERPRTATRQTVRHHLDKLLEVDLVRPDNVPGEEADRTRYRVHPQRLFSVIEDLRSLSVNRISYGNEEDATGTAGGSAETPAVTGPRLALVHGVHEGKMHALRRVDTKRSEGPPRWVIGRGRDADIRLDYDPFVSLENSVVTLRDGVYEVEDLRTSKNGTRVNWKALPPGGRHPLRPGYVLGVGRSLLCFVEE